MLVVFAKFYNIYMMFLFQVEVALRTEMSIQRV